LLKKKAAEYFQLLSFKNEYQPKEDCFLLRYFNRIEAQLLVITNKIESIL